MVLRLSVPYIVETENPVLSIVLRNKPVYYEQGSALSGDVVVDAKKGVHRVKEIVARLVGTAHAQCSGKTGTSEGEHVVLDEDDVIFHGHTANNELGPGHHRFPFAFQLPIHLPTSNSFEHRTKDHRCAASVHYVVTAVMKVTDHMWRNVEAESPFRVRGFRHLKLNRPGLDFHQPHYGKEVAVMTSRWCCRSRGVVSVELRTDKRGYVAGELVQSCVSVKNTSGRDVTACALRLMALVTMTSKGNEIGSFDDVVAEAECGAFAYAETSHFHKQLRVPYEHLGTPLVTGGPAHMPLVHVDYRIELGMEVAGERGDPLRVALGLLIGTVPTCRARTRINVTPLGPANSGSTAI